MTDIARTDGHIDIEATVANLKTKRFREWDVGEFVHCENPKVYTAARQELAVRMFPFFIDILKEMNKHDIQIEKDRVEFFIKTLDIEIVHLIGESPMNEQMKNVLVAYIAAIKDLRHQIFDNDIIGHDMLVGIAAAIELQKDLLEMLGIKMIPLKEGDPHPLQHRIPSLPGITT